MSSFRSALIALALTSSSLGLLSTAHAQAPAQPPVAAATPASGPGAWAKAHPRRAEVNARLANQDRRIHQKVAHGEMSHAHAAQLHHEDRQIRREERMMASQHGGHITKAEQRALNQQENAVSRQIGK